MFLGLGPDIGPVVDDTRNGAHRAAADPGDVLDGQIRHGRGSSLSVECSGTLSGTFSVTIVWHNLYKKSITTKCFRENCIAS